MIGLRMRNLLGVDEVIYNKSCLFRIIILDGVSIQILVDSPLNEQSLIYFRNQLYSHAMVIDPAAPTLSTRAPLGQEDRAVLGLLGSSGC